MQHLQIMGGRECFDPLPLIWKLLVVPIDPPFLMGLVKIALGKCQLEKLGHFAFARNAEGVAGLLLVELVRIIGVMHLTILRFLAAPAGKDRLDLFVAQVLLEEVAVEALYFRDQFCMWEQIGVEFAGSP